MNFHCSTVLGVLFFLGWTGCCDAVILLESGDPAFHTTTPGDNSGWQYEGKFLWALGTPISPHFFITAKHIGGNELGGDIFYFHGDSYTTIGCKDCSGTDLRIWEVDPSKPFPDYAPLSSGVGDAGATTTVIGRGTRRADEVVVLGESKGWILGISDQGERWGKNTVVDVISDPTYGKLLHCTFDNPGIAGECMLSTGDSGGGMFVLEDGLWRLAGINLAADSTFRVGPTGTQFFAAIYDEGGLEYFDDPNWIPVDDEQQNIPANFYGSQIAPKSTRDWIKGFASETDALAAESYSAWQRLYFTPAEIATPETSGPLADFDGDGISNLLEFALNLDPTFSEHATMIPDTGLRGLPTVGLASNGGGESLSLEFVRRTSGSGSGLTYTAEFSSDLQTWQAVGTETVTAINPRWERVIVTDSLTTMDTPQRFGRVRVTLAE